MANFSSTETPSSTPTPPEPRPQASLSTGGRSRLLEGLDALLSEPLRNAPPKELIRHRILVGATCFLVLSNSIYLLWCFHQGFIPYVGILANIGYLSTLVVARKSRTPHTPSMVLLLNLTLGLVGSIFSDKNPTGGEHASNMLLPALAVYLVGPRLALPITLFVVAALGIGHPLYRGHIGIDPSALSSDQLLFGHIFAGVSFLGAWGLGSLHSTARDAAQTSLERTLKELRDSESKLNSVIESTNDIVVSLDTSGNLLTANSATRRFYQQLMGTSLETGQPLFRHASPEKLKEWDIRMAQVCQGQRLRFEETYQLEGARIVMDVIMHPIHGEDGRTVGVTMFGRDVSARKEAETRLGEMHRTLVDVSRQAGMAEVATGVLHNVGNTLNSVNISTSIVTDRLRKSRVSGLAKATQLLREHLSDIPAFFAQDLQGQKLPAYLIALSDQLQEERDALIQEMNSLGESVEHIKSIVSMQQKHARAAGAVEQVAVPQLIDEALRLHAVSFERLGIRVERDYTQVPPIFVDRHKLLQILINLLSNARHALMASPKQSKHLGIRVRPTPEGGSLSIEVDDNGIGILQENMARMFTQGFTTKKTGHGFGLHISALAADEMNGRLTCSSPGPEQGATFRLELPLELTAQRFQASPSQAEGA
ncbi:ATP-binding protein [Vitiosangium sp. GDMCC 1.1324]|uniref:ATP-binding protein n=1 Tax=Vitiosangium sp. (strain GDMCC 1.1324) TaxID=2138576 RepID=UPI000D33DFB0|nr:ATP-binding protein [Vitiosangium sp. GDMCC 1.1324]PTL82172.1 nitrogen regulation protein NtrB [Vitiosangium sp. GDMCC 1.1324]